MAVKRFIKSLIVAITCIVAVGFLLLLVDEGSITGKMTAVTTASTAVPLSNAGLSLFVVFIFFILLIIVSYLFKKKIISKKK